MHTAKLDANFSLRNLCVQLYMPVQMVDVKPWISKIVLKKGKKLKPAILIIILTIFYKLLARAWFLF